MTMTKPPLGQPSVKRRIGKFAIDRKIIESNPRLARVLLKDILIVRAEMCYASNAIEYVGLSSSFDAIDEACHPPEYRIEPMGSYSRKITRVTDQVRGIVVTKEPGPRLIDDDDDEDDDDMPRKSVPKRAKRRYKGDACDCDESDCGCSKAAPVDTGPNPTANPPRDMPRGTHHPVVDAVGKSLQETPANPDYLNITRGCVSHG